MTAKITVSLKPGVLDPQAKAIGHALEVLGFEGIQETVVGKIITLKLAENDATKAKESVTQMCETLLANTVIENYQIELLP